MCRSMLASLAFSLLLSGLSFADIPIPGQPFRPRGPEERPPVAAKDNSTPQRVVVKTEALKHGDVKDARTIKAKIIIPRSLLPGGEKPAAGETQSSLGFSTGTVVAGIALSLAAVSCVFLFRRQGTPARRATVAALVIAGGIGIWSAAHADLIPGRPNGPRRLPGPPAVDGVILLEVAEEGEAITLILPK